MSNCGTKLKSEKSESYIWHQNSWTYHLRGKDMWYSLEKSIKINSFISKQPYLNWCKKNSVHIKLHILYHSINLWILHILSRQVFFHCVWLRDLKMAASIVSKNFTNLKFRHNAKQRPVSLHNSNWTEWIRGIT